MVPPGTEIPMLLDNSLFQNIQYFQTLKNAFILDLRNIDPMKFAPELPTYDLAVHRRGLPFFYVAKICFISLMLLLVARIMYGYLGGFRTQVKVIRIEKKRIANKVIITGLFIFFIFSFLFISTSYKSISLTDKWFAEIIVEYAQDSKQKLEKSIVKNPNFGQFLLKIFRLLFRR